MPTTELNVNTAFQNVMRLSVQDYGALQGSNSPNYLALQTQLTLLSANLDNADTISIFEGSSVLVNANNAAALTIGHLGDSTTSVATLAYEFFTGKTPTSGGYDYLIAPTGGNANNLNSAYYAQFSEENRYINFASNLGKVGAGAAAFQAAYGLLSLSDATTKAYTTIFGTAPTADKVAAILNAAVNIPGESTRTDYFAYYGQDGANGIGTKAAMVGWLLSEAVKADTGTYAQANDSFITALAEGTATFNTDLLANYGHASVGLVGQADMAGHSS